MFSYLLTFQDKNILRRLKINLFKGEKPLSAEIEIVFTELLHPLLRRVEINDEKPEEILR